MSTQDGGPAFPFTEANGANSGDVGMSLRDYFAAKAMQAVITGCISGGDRNDASWLEADQWAPEIAYAVADAMLDERKA